MYIINPIDGGLYKNADLIQGVQTRLTSVNQYYNDEGDVVEVFEESIVPHNIIVPITPYRPFNASTTQQITIESPIDLEKKPRGRPRKERRNERAPTKYNIFIKGVMSDIKKKHPHMTNNERLKECARLWHAHKAGALCD